MSHRLHTSDQPPPLPPRSPRPPIAGYTTSPQNSVPSFPPPPPGLPPRASAVSPTPPGPPPPLPPRPAGYEIRTWSYPPAPFAHPPSTSYAPASPNGRTTLDLPPPPPPPLGPPPPYTASAADVSLSPPNQPRPEKWTGPNASHSPLVSPVSGLSSPTTWSDFPPPPPGPPPLPSPHLSPGIPQYSYNSSRPSSPIGAPPIIPASRFPHEPAKHQANPLGISETHNNDLQAPISPSERPQAYQPPAGILQTFPGASTFSHSEKPPVEAHGAPTPSSEASSSQAASFNSEPPDGVSGKVSPPISPPAQHRPLEPSFQSLHLSSTPPIPPKTPLGPVPVPTQHHPSEPSSPTSGSPLSQSHGGYQAYVPPPHEPPSKTTSPAPSVQPPAANHPSPQQDVVPQARPAAQRAPAPRAVTGCIDSPVTFTTDWYWHTEAADFHICSRCYVDHIHPTAFRSEFHSARHADAKPRVCRFSRARMRDQLWKTAVASGSPREAVAWMRKRAAIPDCRGVGGVRGKLAAGIEWFAPRDGNDIPHFVACEACVEDKLRTNHRFASRFAACAQPQPDDAVWACDMAVPFVEDEYDERARRDDDDDDWAGFAVRAKARMATQPCPGAQGAPVYGRNWFVPAAGPRSLVLCAACYYDYFSHTGEEEGGKWEIAQGLAGSVRCARGVFNVRVLTALTRREKEKNWPLFWDRIARLEREKACEEGGIVDGVWYTLASNPRDFGVCSACYIGVLEPLGVTRFWAPKRDVEPGAKLLCCLNMGHPRLWKFTPRLDEMYYTLDPTALDEYASLYASVPLCLRDEDRPNLRWYGWRDCTICPECYLEFARHGPLAKMMELHDAPLADSVMCEMYSERMRTLYTECGSTNPANLKPLLEYSTQRRQVYMETIPQARMIMSQAKMALQRQKMLNVMGSHYAFAGQLQQNTYGTPYTYSAPGIGSGFANSNALQGAAYGQEAMNIAADLGSGRISSAVGQLEQRWRAVE
ncbi:hypothetical protein F5B21DRAFT_443233 [Xylaria acuta]|nr:hypothetical protein F5B21DRAFT_443233 [Xylaria acuta]